MLTCRRPPTSGVCQTADSLRPLGARHDRRDRRRRAASALRRLRRGRPEAAVDRDRQPAARVPPARRPPAPLGLGRPAPAGRTGRGPGPGRPRRRTPGHRAGQPGTRRPAVRHPHAVGRHPVPRGRRGRAVAPARAGRVPVCCPRRGGLDRGERRPGADAGRGPAAHPVVALARPPPRRRRADRLARRPGHPAGEEAGRQLLRVRRRQHRGQGDPRAVPLRATVGARGRRPWPNWKTSRIRR